MTRVIDTKSAKSIAFGSRPATSLEEYWEAWQWLKDNNIPLSEPDELYLDKLICDGVVL